MISERDKATVRELAKKYMDAVCTDKQEAMLLRFRDTNDLKAGRPPILLDEIPWHEMDIDGELTPICENQRARGLELTLRRRLYYLKYFEGMDNLWEPVLRVWRAYDSTGIGVKKEEQILRTDIKNNIVSHGYKDVLVDESVLERMHDPEFTLRPDIDAEKMEFYTDLLGDSMPVRLCGHGNYYDAPWDTIATLHGVENMLIDMYDRPEFLHEIIKRFTSAAHATIDFLEKNLDAEEDIAGVHCTPAPITVKKEKGKLPVWYRRTAQAFGVVSPAMFEEFEADYIKPLAERFAFTYYGCCEPLDGRIDILKKTVPNLRKIGCSPWASVEKCAEQIGGDFVLSRKPNPANVAIKTDADIIKREIEETVKICIKYGCPYDISLKDISTVSNRPENLITWVKAANEVLCRYYG